MVLFAIIKIMIINGKEKEFFYKFIFLDETQFQETFSVCETTS